MTTTDHSSARAKARVALVLGAGGVAGQAFHAGILAALAQETSWDARNAELILGTSAGSVVALSLRAGLAPADVYARATDSPLSREGNILLAALPPQDDGAWWLENDWLGGTGRRLPFPASPGMLAHAARRPWTARPGVLMAGILPAGRFDVSRIAIDSDRLVSAAPAPIEGLWIAAVRLRDGQRVVFGRDAERQPAGWTWGQAVAASCAIPGFFEPVTIAGERFVDGGADSPTNAHLVGEMNPDLVIVSSPMSAVRSRRNLRLDSPVRAAYRMRLAAEVARLRRKGVPVLVFQPTAPVLAAAGINAMSPQVRAPVALAAFEAATERCRGEKFARHAELLAA